MNMPFNQDDARERAMVAALNLTTRPDREGEDGFKDVNLNGQSHRLLFECKSAPVNKEFSTSRDTGMSKLNEWSNYHFAFGWFVARDNIPIRMWYGSPRMMRGWLEKEKEYLQSDLTLSGIVPAKVDDAIVTALFGDGQQFTYAQMYKVMKAQWEGRGGRPSRYKDYADIHKVRRTADNLYSRKVALRATQERTDYLMRRGSTVNNRHISRGYVIANCKELEPTAWVRSLDIAIEEEIALEPPNNPVDA
jgi:hypothetical protein